MEDDKKILRFRIEFITSEEDSDEVTGVIDNQKKVGNYMNLKEKI